MVENTSFIGFLYNASWAFALLPFLTALLTMKYWSKSVFLNPLFVLLSLALLMELVQGFKARKYINIYYLVHLYTILEFILITMFYGRFFRVYFNPLPFYITIPLLLGVAFYDYNVDGLKNFDGFTTSAESIFLIGFSMFFFYYALKHLLIEDKLVNSPVFWINTAVLIYFSGNLFMFSFNNYLMQTDPSKRYILWGTIHSFFNIMFNLFIAIGFWKTKTK